MQWSRYNTLFRSDLGRFCYSSLSNTLLELDEIHYALLEACQRGHELSGARNNGFFGLLREKYMLVEAEEEDGLLLARHYRRQALAFETSTLRLTVCPTLRCNFRCSYCFQDSQQDGLFMNAKTQERLVEWIKEQATSPKIPGKAGIRALAVAWYGGEPLLAFETIRSLSERFLALDLSYEKAVLVTNGYLLDREKIARLNDLRIGIVQITLDGPPEMHDARRVLADGGPTFSRILGNVEALMESDYAGMCSIRVNVDKRNAEGFLALREELLVRFRGKNVSVSPARVDVMGGSTCDGGCRMDTEEWTDFGLELARRHGVLPAWGLHPLDQEPLCVAGSSRSFVLGPEGELYKCWDDAGRPGMVVGSIHAPDTITDAVLTAQYSTGVDPYSDPECRACVVLPICGGGCPHRRLLAKYRGQEGARRCSPYKTRLRDYLEAYIDTLRTREICATLLKAGATATGKTRTGYRVISPAAARKPENEERA